MHACIRYLPLILATLVLTACGGGGGGGSSTTTATATSSSSSSTASTCSNTEQLNFVRNHVDNDYLFYKDAPQTTAASYAGQPADFFLDLTSRAQPAKDRFSFVITAAEAAAMFQSGSATGVGIDTRRDSAQSLRVALVQPGSPAALGGLKRGDRITAINGSSVSSNLSSAQINALYYGKVGDKVSLAYVRQSDGASISVTLTAASFSSDPLPLASTLTAGSTKIGYLAFHEHTQPSEAKLASAINNFAKAGISDLVLDMRYNGGGYLAIAGELGYMIAGSKSLDASNSVGYKTFQRLVHNDKRSADNYDFPFMPLKLLNYYDTGLAVALPSLSLKRVYVLTTSSTCSASEAVINGLRGIDVEVITIGGKTCGKPYGMYETDNCGNAYFALAFKGLNAKGFGDYEAGLTANCTVADDFSHELGNSSEAMLAAALTHRSTGSCPTTSVAFALQSSGSVSDAIVQDDVPLRGLGSSIMR
ncbi:MULTISPECIES: S41 family peptidase [unclassified Uliginosibacterium]|uniref:S41 family peptidase n=1 Tax=unclassified Uliginosibacterium TaxID=2621521 RepID=UPI000C7A2938|nr:MULTISPECIES: S41 family peptidase [unclassified Uliginosibacterium]MDO6385839.1 S41 family peptidase [Uliginosibacterium sp. 31-12]PLK49857.1 peptidase S41 [Uliginosibacterium sp. TH139]